MFGVIIGSIAGYFGGQVDNVIMRVLDVIQSLPGMLLTIVISAVLGADSVNTILALRSMVYLDRLVCLVPRCPRVRDSEYIEAAQSINCRSFALLLST